MKVEKDQLFMRLLLALRGPLRFFFKAMSLTVDLVINDAMSIGDEVAIGLSR